MGAWIEILISIFYPFSNGVAPLVGAWIEIVNVILIITYVLSRSPCGSVD